MAASDPVTAWQRARDRYPVLGPIVFQWIRAEESARLSLTMTYRAAPPEGGEMVLAFDNVTLERFGLDFYSERYDLCIEEMRGRGWDVSQFHVEDDDGGGWLAFWADTMSVSVSV